MSSQRPGPGPRVQRARGTCPEGQGPGCVGDRRDREADEAPEGEERARSHVHMRGEEGSRSLPLSPAKSLPLLTRDSFT